MAEECRIRAPGFSVLVRTAFAIAAAVLLLATPASAPARPRKPRVRYEDPRASRPSAVYASMGRRACLDALAARKIDVSVVESAPGVRFPVRLRGSIAGVAFRTDAPAIERASSPAEVFDCRLVLALHDFAKVLAAHGIDEVRIASAWRPAKRGRSTDRPRIRHGGALAVDVKRLGKKLAPGEATKRWLTIATDFRAAIDEPVCAVPKSPLPAAAKELRQITCEARDRKAFTAILTPAYNRAHHDHLHVEIRPGVTWSLFL